MFGSKALEVAIGVIFVYILVSIICSAVREGIEAWTKTRAAYLEHGIRELLHDEKATGLARQLFNHPLIDGLYSGSYKPGKSAEKSAEEPAKGAAKSSARPAMFAGGGNLPSYIPARNFAVALLDIAARGPTTDAVSSDPRGPAISLESVRTNIKNLANPHVQRVLLTALDTAQGDLNRVQAALEAWYNSAMDRVSGWYKRATHWIIFCIGVAVAVGLNVNTITIADYLYRNDAARAALVARAESAAKDTSITHRDYTAARQALDSLSLPIGWSAGWGAPRRGDEVGAEGAWNEVIAPILGWLLTALAATLGAPFWFDVLNKVMVIRSTVKPHEKSPEEASQDRQQRVALSVVPGTGTTPATGGAVGAMPAGPGTPSSPSIPGTRGTPGAPGAGPPGVSDRVPSPRDEESDIDGCDVDFSAQPATGDEDLPAAEGGVAQHA